MARWRLGASTTFEILPHSTCTFCQQKSYISKGNQPIFEIFASARRCWGWAFGWKVSSALIIYVANDNVKTLCINNIWNSATSNLYTVPAKILYLQRYSTDFQNLCISSKSLRMRIRVESFRCTRILVLQWQGENSRINNIWNFDTFNLYTVPAKILYLQRYSTVFRNLCLRSKMVRVDTRVESFRVKGILLFQWQGENLAHQQHLKFWYTVPAKILDLQRYSTDFRNLCLSSKMLRVGIWLESFKCADNLRCQWQCENFVHQQHLKFCHFQPVHCASKNPISPKVFNRFSKSLHHLQDVDDAHLGGKFKMHTYFTLAMARWKLRASTTSEILPLSTCTQCQQKSYISKGIQPFFEIFASDRRWWGWTLGWKVSGAKVFYFCNGKVKTLRINNIWNFGTRCRRKSYISKGTQPIFEIFASARRCWGWAFGWKVSSAQIIYVANDNVKTLCINNIWNFATSNLYTVPAKILYLQRYSTEFQNLCIISKTLRMRIWVESLRCTRILLLQWQGENFAHQQHLKFCQFQPVQCASRNPISPEIFSQFSKSSPQLGDVEGGHLGGKFEVRRYFTFAMTRWNFAQRQLLKFCYFQAVHFASKNPISPKVFSRFSKSLHQLEDVEGGAFGWKVSWAQVFYFCNEKVKSLRIDNIWNFATFNLYTVPAKILYLPRYSTDFRNLSVSSKILKVGIWVESFRCAGILFLQ